MFVIKLLCSLILIITAVQIGRKFPSLGGLIATMPLTSVIVLVWLYTDNPGKLELMENYTRGALGGIIASILFFVTAYICFRRHVPFLATICLSFGIWFIGAFIHQRLLK